MILVHSACLIIIMSYKCTSCSCCAAEISLSFLCVNNTGRYPEVGPDSDNSLWMMGNPNWGSISLHLGEVRDNYTLINPRPGVNYYQVIPPPPPSPPGLYILYNTHTEARISTVSFQAFIKINHHSFRANCSSLRLVSLP